MSAPLPGRARIAWRVAGAAWLVGWFWKTPFWIENFRIMFRHPVVYDGLPGWLQPPWLALAAWLAPLFAAWPLWRPRRLTVRIAAPLMLVSAFVGCVHVETFSDATFLTSFWSAAWLTWLAWAPDDEAIRRHGPLLSRSVLAFVFLGAAVGKTTPEYLGGDAFYHLYFLQRDRWPYDALREHEALGRALARALGRGSVAAEWLAVTGPLWRHRAYTIFFIAVALTMVAISTWMLMSVLVCLGGLVVAAELAARR